MGNEGLTLEQRGQVALITMNRPPVNAWNLANLEKFAAALTAIESDRQVRAVVLTGGGEKCFSAGFDVADAANAARTGPLGRELWRRLDCFAKPVIAAINGHALGGGLELALSCHFRLAADKEDVKLGLTELNLGIMPGWGGTQRLARVVGRATALEMILLGRTLSPQEAHAVGLVNRLVPPAALLDSALELAGRLAARPPLAVAWVLRAMTAGSYESLSSGLATEAEGSCVVGLSNDSREGFKAFLEKRPPVFSGE
jgi:enoyl-CoA hydratase/carnithine racemase